MYFLSYSRQQLYFAEALVNTMQGLGLDVWFDLQRLLPGSNWQQGIQNGLDHCEGVILIASHASIDSPYVEHEWHSSIAAGKPIYVVLFEAVTLPAELKQSSVCDLRRDFDRKVILLHRAIIEHAPIHDPIPRPNFMAFPTVVEPAVRAVFLLLFINALMILFTGVDWYTHGLSVYDHVQFAPLLIAALPGLYLLMLAFYFIYRELGYQTVLIVAWI